MRKYWKWAFAPVPTKFPLQLWTRPPENYRRMLTTCGCESVGSQEFKTTLGQCHKGAAKGPEGDEELEGREVILLVDKGNTTVVMGKVRELLEDTKGPHAHSRVKDK